MSLGFIEIRLAVRLILVYNKIFPSIIRFIPHPKCERGNSQVFDGLKHLIHYNLDSYFVFFSVDELSIKKLLFLKYFGTIRIDSS